MDVSSLDPAPRQSAHRSRYDANDRGDPARRGAGRRLILPLALAALAAGAGCEKSKAPPPPPPPDVDVMTVAAKDVPVTQEWVGTLAGFVDAQIRAQVTGYLAKQDYREGSMVHAGDLLFEIDPRPMQAALDQALAQLAVANAQAAKAAEDEKRYGPLAKTQAISQQEFDDAVQASLAAQAQVKAAQAAVETAQLNLAFTRVTSPVDGIAGLIQAQIGDLVGPSTGVLTTVSTIDPMKAYFPISEQTYLDFQKQEPGAKGFPEKVALELILVDGSVYPHPGKFFAADRQIDPGTGTLRVAATFPNPDGLLRPGQYARVRAVVRTAKDAVLVPQRALSELQGGYQAAVVDGENKVHLRTVDVGPQIGGDWLVEHGLKAGERIVVEGLQKVRDGGAVHPLREGSAKAP